MPQDVGVYDWFLLADGSGVKDYRCRFQGFRAKGLGFRVLGPRV
jgi:hypothetical protein